MLSATENHEALLDNHNKDYWDQSQQIDSPNAKNVIDSRKELSHYPTYSPIALRISGTINSHSSHENQTNIRKVYFDGNLLNMDTVYNHRKINPVTFNTSIH